MLDLDDFLPYRLNVLAKRVSRELARRYEAQFGISIPEWRVMAILGREQPLSSNDIVERSAMDKAKVSRAVTSLVEAGLLSRDTHPSDQRLLRLPAYLQQLDMESNGKRVRKDGSPIERPSGPLVWGELGTNGQHAFYQLIHQGTDTIPCEFMVAAEGHEPELAHQHRLLLANCLAQSEALMKGRTLEEARELLAKQGLSEADIAALAPHKVFPGNRPSVTIAYRRLDPFTLGRLIALYEHRVFVEAAIWGINAFDQWGVELGKELATALLPVIEGRAPADAHDSSTAGLAGYLTASS